MPKALYYNLLKYQKNSLDLLHKNFDVITLNSPDDDDDTTLETIDVLFAPLGYMVDKTKIDKCHNLKVVASNTTGHPHIDVDYCHEKNIAVACLKYEQDFLKEITPTSELAFGMMIALTRNMLPAYKSVLNGQWNRRPFGTPQMLSNMSIGIIGLGRLGSNMAKYCKAFGMLVYYFDPYVNNDEYIKCATLAETAKQADVISVHVPHEKNTKNMFDAAFFSHMKDQAYFINTARGELVEWKALLESLKIKKLAGAALDVFEGEFSPTFNDNFHKHDFLEYAREHDNVIITPHIGGSTIDAWAATEMKTIEMAISCFSSKRSNESFS